MPREFATVFLQSEGFGLRSVESLQIEHIVHLGGMPRRRAVAFTDHRGVLFNGRRA